LFHILVFSPIASTEDRLSALTEIVTATKLHNQVSEFAKTITFLQTRLCNAVEDERKKGISLLLSGMCLFDFI
jgi:hypothetical protein